MTSSRNDGSGRDRPQAGAAIVRRWMSWTIGSRSRPEHASTGRRLRSESCPPSESCSPPCPGSACVARSGAPIASELRRALSSRRRLHPRQSRPRSRGRLELRCRNRAQRSDRRPRLESERQRDLVSARDRRVHRLGPDQPTNRWHRSTRAARPPRARARGFARRHALPELSGNYTRTDSTRDSTGEALPGQAGRRDLRTDPDRPGRPVEADRRSLVPRQHPGERGREPGLAGAHRLERQRVRELSPDSRGCRCPRAVNELWVYANVENIGDEAVRDALSFPQPGRHVIRRLRGGVVIRARATLRPGMRADRLVRLRRRRQLGRRSADPERDHRTELHARSGQLSVRSRGALGDRRPRGARPVQSSGPLHLRNRLGATRGDHLSRHRRR